MLFYFFKEIEDQVLIDNLTYSEISLNDFVVNYNKNLSKLDTVDFPATVDIGIVLSIGDGIVKTSGLSAVKSGELVYFPQANNMQGMVINLETDSVGIVLFGNDRLIKEGYIVCRSNKTVSVPVGFEVLGRVLDALCNPIDGKGQFNFQNMDFKPIDIKAPGIIDRQTI